MVIKFYYTKSPNNKIGKHLDAEIVFTGNLRDSTNVIKPEVIIEANSLTGYNYAFIPIFNRYYYIDEIVSYRTGLWLVKLKVDVLESFKNEIKNLDCIINYTEEYKGDNYLSSDIWINNVKATTDILTFNSGLLDSGEYILITAGG